MATAAFKLPRAIPELIIKVRFIVEKLIANIAVYATPAPTAARLTTLVDNLERSELAAAKGGTDKTFRMYLDRQILKENMARLLGYIQTASEGDASKINLVADVKKKAVPKGLLPAPGNVRSFYTERDGEILFRWQGVAGHSMYAMQLNKSPGDKEKWVNIGFTGKNRYTAYNLISGKPYSFRVATISTAGISDWSDVTTHRAS